MSEEGYKEARKRLERRVLRAARRQDPKKWKVADPALKLDFYDSPFEINLGVTSYTTTLILDKPHDQYFIKVGKMRVRNRFSGSLRGIYTDNEDTYLSISSMHRRLDILEHNSSRARNLFELLEETV